MLAVHQHAFAYIALPGILIQLVIFAVADLSDFPAWLRSLHQPTAAASADQLAILDSVWWALSFGLLMAVLGHWRRTYEQHMQRNDELAYGEQRRLQRRSDRSRSRADCWWRLVDPPPPSSSSSQQPPPKLAFSSRVPANQYLVRLTAGWKLAVVMWTANMLMKHARINDYNNVDEHWTAATQWLEPDAWQPMLHLCCGSAVFVAWIGRELKRANGRLWLRDDDEVFGALGEEQLWLGGQLGLSVVWMWLLYGQRELYWAGLCLWLVAVYSSAVAVRLCMIDKLAGLLYTPVIVWAALAGQMCNQLVSVNQSSESVLF